MDISDGSDSSDYSPDEEELMEYNDAQMATELETGAGHDQGPCEDPPHHLLPIRPACSQSQRATSQSLPV